MTAADKNPGDNLSTVIGFGPAHPLYLTAGLVPLALPARKKHSPPGGYTGWVGDWPKEKNYALWSVEFSDGNIAIRMNKGVEVDGVLWDGLGIDADGYGIKTGLKTIEEGERRWGKLPPTYYSTSRDDGSRILFYRIRAGRRFGGKLAFRELGYGDVELIQWFHRYAVVAPSIHPDTGRQYQWFTPDGEVMERPPPFSDWAVLSGEWIENLPQRCVPQRGDPHGDSDDEKKTTKTKREKTTTPQREKRPQRHHSDDRGPTIGEGRPSASRSPRRSGTGAVPSRHHARPGHGAAALRAHR